jgi:hypothetical protein
MLPVVNTLHLWDDPAGGGILEKTSTERKQETPMVFVRVGIDDFFGNSKTPILSQRRGEREGAVFS